MRERPIIMSAPMVRAILAGTKTQTRRAVKPHQRDDGFVIMEGDGGNLWPYRSDDEESCFVTIGGYLCEEELHCPYGKVGDRLWVRETWRADDAHDSVTMYRTDVDDDYARLVKWRSPIHMPRDRSRITLEITGVRVERLDELSANDAQAEGVASVDEFIRLWKTINHTWEPSTWVWVLQFQKV